MEKSLQVFCCYAHRDKDFLDEFKAHLSSLQRQNVISLWHDGDISAGTEWDQEIKKRLKDAKIILLLISADFINSDYCYSIEMQQALSRHKQGEAKVISVILRPIAVWKTVSSGDIRLGDLQALPTDAKPITSWTNRDEAWEDVVIGIEGVINELLMRGPVSYVGSGQERTSAKTVNTAEQATVIPPVVKPIGTLLFRYTGHSWIVKSLAWSPDGKRIASGSADSTVQVWNADGRKQPLTFNASGQVPSLTWSPDGERIASASTDGPVQVWNAHDGKQLFALNASGRVLSLTWSPDGKRIALGSTDSTVQVWNADGSGQPLVYKGHETWFNVLGYVLSLVWSPDSTHVASIYGNGTVRIWNIDRGGQPFIYKGHYPWLGIGANWGSGGSVAWSPDGKRIASGSFDGTVQVWNVDGSSQPLVYKGHSGHSPLSHISSLAWSPDGRRIASASFDHTVQVWGADDRGHVFIYKGHSDWVHAVVWSPDGEYIASGSSDHTVQVWSAG